MASRILQPASEISTHFRCDRCGLLISSVAWKQCKVCKEFDLCESCGKIEYGVLSQETRTHHQRIHGDKPVNNDCMRSILVDEAETFGQQTRNQRRRKEYERILNEKKIKNDYDLAVVMDILKRTKLDLSSPSSSSEANQINSIIIDYNLKASRRDIHVLSLDGGGVRGYMSIKILAELITQKYLPNVDNSNLNDLKYKESFHQAQLKFTNQFDYFVGTSTGGLISFCLAINYNILDMMEIYSDSGHYFKKNWLGPVIYSKYDPSVIHKKIDDIIDSIVYPGNKKISAKNATLLDIRNLLNPDHVISEADAKLAMFKHGNVLEFVDDKDFKEIPFTIDEGANLHQVNREKVLLITSYNTTLNMITIFNTSYAKHWGYRIADILKSTMAAPTYFPPHEVYQGIQDNGIFLPGKTSELFIDGGVFANDPQIAALWAIRMQWKKPLNYHILAIGTGCYTSTLSSSTWGGYLGWIFNNGILVNALMDATRSFTEIIAGNLAKFNNMRRMKLNYQITEPLALDDPKFVQIFNKEWEHLKNEQDYKALVYFYDNYIAEKD